MPNLLAAEKSPYLLQHAHNPVDWRPWGPEAFAKARKEDKPIFLSVGYSTCHWCHVMERESFEDEKIAEILNRDFVSIKVDREERPDVDRVYMTYVQATTGGGGWPMTVFLTPELKPFFGGAYFPPENRYGRAGFPLILERIAEVWRNDRPRVLESSGEVLRQLEQQTRLRPAPAGLNPGALDSAFSGFRRSFDSRLGGFGGAPKFPRPVVHNFLLRYWARTRNREALDMVLLTLREMAKGGMNDQLGGGFHRYSVDERWFVPHFEKMLYDQAQLAISYLEAFQITGEALYAGEARRIFDYVLRDLRDPGGAFYSAEDADSILDPEYPKEKAEGAFYVWSRDEIEAIAGSPAADWFCFRYGVGEDGNVENDPHGEFPGKNILYQAHSLEETAGRFSKSPGEVQAGILQACRMLLEARARRPRPHRDDKILTAWNGLMISAFAKGGAILGEPRYAEAARRAAGFILGRMYDSSSGTLLRRYREDEAAIPGFLDDYAFFTQALLDLYESGFDFRDLEAALRLTGKQRELFEDPEQGGFYSTAVGDPSLVMRIKEDYDGAEPSGNSVAALNLLRLAELTGRNDFRDSAQKLLHAFSQRIVGLAAAVPQMLAALEFSLSKPKQIILAGDPGAPDARELLRVLAQKFVPGKIVMLADAAARLLPAAAPMTALDGRVTAYVCQDYTCQLPTTDPRVFENLL